MSIPDFATEHFLVPSKQIEEWNENKISLPRGAKAKFIAPKDLVVILRKPFYYYWNYETDGRIDRSPTLVYGEKWVNQEISHLPYCKELLEINEHLKQYGWFIPVSWTPLISRLVTESAKTLGIFADGADILYNLLDVLKKRFKLKLSGYVLEDELWGVGQTSSFWSISEYSACATYCLLLVPSGLNSVEATERYTANPVRCMA